MRRMPHNLRHRHGVSALLAMMYLVLFSTMAVGFYATTNTAAQVAHNDKTTSRALLAAETGMDFARYHLRQLTIPALCPQDKLIDEVYADLAAAMDNTGNLKGGTVGFVNKVITIPAATNQFVDVSADGDGFRLVIEQVGQRVRVRSYGRADATSAVTMDRGVQLEYGIAMNASSIFNFGVASKSKISMNSNARVTGVPASLGNVLSTTIQVPALYMDSNAAIAGDVSFTNETPVFTALGNSTVSGFPAGSLQAADHIHRGVEMPEFPAVDPSIFVPYATNILNVPGKKYADVNLKNIRIKANTNPIIDGSSVVEGVILIETPNIVRFLSNSKIKGVIIAQPNPTGNPVLNQIEFDSNVTIEGVETLDPAVHGDLVKLTGSAILAPKFSIRFNSNFGLSGGSVIASKIHFDSNAKGTIKGSVINLDDTAVQFDGNSAITIESRGTKDFPAGVKFGQYYVPLPDTYEELRS